MQRSAFQWLTYMLLSLVPVTLALRYIWPAQTPSIFVFASVRVIALAGLLSEATENLSTHTGPAWGALLNVTFGNAGESCSSESSRCGRRRSPSSSHTIGSSTQTALFVAPMLVIASHWIAPTPLQLLALPIDQGIVHSCRIAIACRGSRITEQIASDGESNWFEGVQLIVVYLFIAAMVYLLPPSSEGG